MQIGNKNNIVSDFKLFINSHLKYFKKLFIIIFMDSAIAGFISGISQTLIGHPFDTMKTWNQNSILLKKPKFNIKNLYKGVFYPLLQNPIIVSGSMASNHIIKEETNNIYFSSFCSGILTSIVICPLDKYKIMRQQHIKYDINFKNTIKSFKDIHLCMLREVPATVIYFSSYNKMKENEIPIFISGSIAGCLSWIVTYPIDTVKSRLQSNSCSSIKEAIRQKNLFLGFGNCIIRAFIVNGIGFSIYEKILKSLKK